MIVERLIGCGTTMYPYKYRVAVPKSNMTPLDDVVNWADEIGLKCCIVPGAAYVCTEQDAMLIVMKWS